MSGVATFAVNAQHRSVTKRVLLYDGVSEEEVQEIMRAAFRLRYPIVGFRDVAQDTTFPLSLRAAVRPAGTRKPRRSPERTQSAYRRRTLPPARQFSFGSHPGQTAISRHAT